jgi:hypothetical protein
MQRRRTFRTVDYDTILHDLDFEVDFQANSAWFVRAIDECRELVERSERKAHLTLHELLDILDIYCAILNVAQN